MLATDVAARGLNLQDCDWTIQYDPPAEISDYVHRAGRVARAGRAGHSLLFLLPSEREFLTELKARGVSKLSALALSATLNTAAKICSSLTRTGVEKSGGVIGNLDNNKTSRLGEAFSSELQRRLEELVSLDETRSRASKRKSKKAKELPRVEKNLGEMARVAFLSHIRAYPTREKCVKHVFSAKALHLGHVARCFGLKEPPKRLALKNKDTAAAAAAVANERKRNRAMEFGTSKDFEGGDALDESEPYVESAVAQPKSLKPMDGPDPKKARVVMMENARRLLSQGMDA